MKEFYVIKYDFNSKTFKSWDIMPFLRDCYKESKKKPKTHAEFKKFIKDESFYQFWSRCEYEIVLCDWPCQKVCKKIDIYEQVLMNLDTIAQLLMNDVCKQIKH